MEEEYLQLGSSRYPTMGMVTKTISVSAMTAEAVEVTEVGPNLYRLDEEAALFLGAGDDEDVDDEEKEGVGEGVNVLCGAGEGVADED